MTIAGTEMQCLEIYTGEAYTLPIAFTDANGNPANASVPNNWQLNTSANFYTITDVIYNSSSTEVNIGNLIPLSPQPPSANYNISANWISRNAGTAYLYIGNNITNNPANGVPTVSLANSAANSVLCLVTLTITKQSDVSNALVNINREPIGFIVRYQ